MQVLSNAEQYRTQNIEENRRGSDSPAFSCTDGGAFPPAVVIVQLFVTLHQGIELGGAQLWLVISETLH